MTYKQEQKIAQSFRKLLGEQVWLSLTKTRRLALLELVETLGYQMFMSKNMNTPIDIDKIVKFAEQRLIEVRAKEFLALISGNIGEFPEIGINDFNLYQKEFNILRMRMVDIIQKIRDLKLEKKFLQKRRDDIIQAIEQRCSIPGDDADLLILEMATGEEILRPEQRKAIEEWLKEQE